MELCDHFTAPSDEIAASTIDWDGGPSRLDAEKRGLLRRSRTQERPPTVDLNGVEPFVQMRTLDEISEGSRNLSDDLDLIIRASSSLSQSARP